MVALEHRQRSKDSRGMRVPVGLRNEQNAVFLVAILVSRLSGNLLQLMVIGITAHVDASAVVQMPRLELLITPKIHYHRHAVELVVHLRPRQFRHFRWIARARHYDLQRASLAARRRGFSFLISCLAATTKAAFDAMSGHAQAHLCLGTTRVRGHGVNTWTVSYR